MLTATIRGAPPRLLDALALAWIAVRLAYTAAYLLDAARIRPALWFISVLISVAIFIWPA